jgi:hypothetical protein
MAIRHYLAIPDLALGGRIWSIVFLYFAGVTSAADAFADVPQQAPDALASAVEDMIARVKIWPRRSAIGQQAKLDRDEFHNPRYIVRSGRGARQSTSAWSAAC